jgi:hypothetical protein
MAHSLVDIPARYNIVLASSILHEGLEELDLGRVDLKWWAETVKFSTRRSVDSMELAELSDPSDWASTAIPQLSSLDSNLRCVICKEFFTAPVITTCFHTFCSVCIRRCLSAESSCPTCRATNIYPSGLRKNNAMHDAVISFQDVRYIDVPPLLI